MPAALLVMSLLVPVTALIVTTSPSDSVEVSATVTMPLASIEVALIEVPGLLRLTL